MMSVIEYVAVHIDKATQINLEVEDIVADVHYRLQTPKLINASCL